MALGSQLVQKPPEMGAAVKSAFQVWPGYFETILHCLDASSVVGSGGLTGFSFKIRPTVVLPMWIPALASVSAIFTLPSVGQNSLIC